MHFDPKYGKPTRFCCDVYVDVELPQAPDNWSAGVFQAKVNALGVYVHRFQMRDGQKPEGNMPEAIKKILKGEIPTPCTYIGPSASHTYSHAVWANTGGLIFGPRTRQVLGFKRDFWSNRLADLCRQTHGNFRGIFNWRDKLDSIRDYSRYVEQSFAKAGDTQSFFGTSSRKKLHLVNSALILQTKLREMEARANLHFVPERFKPAEGFDCASKVIVARIWQQYGRGGITVEGVAQCLENWMQHNPSHAVFMRAGALKLRNMPNNAAVAAYIQAANTAAARSYAQMLHQAPATHTTMPAYQITQGTALTPNEVLAMPSAKDLVGVYIQTTSILGFEQVMLTHATLQKYHKVQDRAVRIPPMTQVLSHKANCSVIQLGWSRHVLPWTQKGLLQHVAQGFICGIDHNDQQTRQFEPDLFGLIERLAECAVVSIGPEPLKADGLWAHPNLPQDLHTVVDAGGKHVLVLAVQHQRALPTIQLLCCLCHAASLASQAGREVLPRILNDALDAAKHYSAAQEFLAYFQDCNTEQRNGLWCDLLTTTMNARYAKRELSMQYRNGYGDAGVFRMNPELCGLALALGQRTYPNKLVMTGLFDTEHAVYASCREAGSAPVFGVLARNPNVFQFGHIDPLGQFEANPMHCIVVNKQAPQHCSFKLQTDAHWLFMAWQFKQGQFYVTWKVLDKTTEQAKRTENVFSNRMMVGLDIQKSKMHLLVDALGVLQMMDHWVNQQQQNNKNDENWALWVKAYQTWGMAWAKQNHSLKWGTLPEEHPLQKQLKALAGWKPQHMA